MRSLSSYLRVAILITATSCARDVEETQRHKCTRFRDHLVDLRVADLPAARQDSVAAAHREAMTQALGDGFVATCVQNIGNADLDCALAARDVVTASSCLERKR